MDKKIIFLFQLIIIFSFFPSLAKADNLFSALAAKEEKTKRLHIHLDGEVLEVNLHSPSTNIEYYPNGRIKHIAIDGITILYEIDFYPGYLNAPSQPSLVQQYTSYENQLLLNGPTIRFDRKGNVLSITHWKIGKLDGAQKIYNNDIALIEERHYEMGYPVKLWNSYYINGKKATTIQFPKSIIEWEKSLVGMKHPLSRELYNAPFQHPITIEEKWYDQDGLLYKAFTRQAWKSGESFTVRNTGKATSYNPYGEIVQKREAPSGTGREELFLPGPGSITTKRSAWFDRDLFNETAVTLPQAP
ncbi:hypothetical protein JYU14_03420 [Simkania negevensis]|uniref:Uncharacterized protein n=1 Tax=Simkania negevensis TaxID=83561 RepID=A0ABS3ARF9_9BACT|nr:hypothetical protein [Simkania negevensis]